MRTFAVGVAGVLTCSLGVPFARASFHFMQIEQVIGGVNGDTTAQAIQLRMRSGFQNSVQLARIRAWSASGTSPVVVIDFTTSVPNGVAGDHVLIASAAFGGQTSPAAVADFTMSNLIPASYLAAGSLTFEGDTGIIYWRLSWGGAGYTGATSGSITNDADGDFGPPFPGPLPSTGLQALAFTGTASAPSTSNAADYSLTPGAAVFSNNAGDSFLVAGASRRGDLDGDLDVDRDDWALLVDCLGGPENAIPPTGCNGGTFSLGDLDGDSDIDLGDVAEFQNIFGQE